MQAKCTRMSYKLTCMHIPHTVMSNPHLDFAGEIRAATGFPTFHAANIPDVATARHTIGTGTGKIDID